MPTTIAPDQEALFAAITALIQLVVPIGTPIVRAIDNRVSMPLDGFVEMTPIYQQPLSTNVREYDDPGTPTGGTQNIRRPTEVQVQIDCYGPVSMSWATAIETLWRDPIGCSTLAPSCQPLFANQSRMIPLVNGEQQYEERWLVEAHLQYNPVTTVQQQFAGALAVNLINVDATYPP